MKKTLVYDANIIDKYINNMAKDIISEFKESNKDIAFIGLQSSGVPLAEKLKKIVAEKLDAIPEVATLDISMYRDDIGIRKNITKLKVTDIPFDINDKIIILVDDILHTGRTVRAALDAITDYGRPQLIRLAVLIDRKLREYPIQPDYTGEVMSVPIDHKLIMDWSEITLNKIIDDTI